MAVAPWGRNLLCTLVLLAVLALPSGAAEYADLPQQHWAHSDMTQAAALGILNGVGGGKMDPGGALTWGQYLAMTARAFVPEAYAAALSAGAPWDSAGLAALRQTGLLRPDEIPRAATGDPITRGDAALLLARGLEVCGGVVYTPADGRTRFSDWAGLDPARQRAVGVLLTTGVVSGRADGTFGGGDGLLRCDGSALLLRTLRLVDQNRRGTDLTVLLQGIDGESGRVLFTARPAEVRVGDPLSALAERQGVAGYRYRADPALPGVSWGCRSYTLQYLPLATGTPEVTPPVATAPVQDSGVDDWLYYPGENARKRQLLFGDGEKRRFASREEADAGVTAVTVPVWRLVGGSKVPGTCTLTVHRALADEVTAIFTEIYADPEQFPIRDAGGYSWRGDSAAGEHNCGTAIDLNAAENYQVRDGLPLAGTLWQPGENPYSLPADGSVVRIFTAHGWTWGGDAWAEITDPATGYHDYMHFSYLGG